MRKDNFAEVIAKVITGKVAAVRVAAITIINTITQDDRDDRDGIILFTP